MNDATLKALSLLLTDLRKDARRDSQQGVQLRHAWMIERVNQIIDIAKAEAAEKKVEDG